MSVERAAVTSELVRQSEERVFQRCAVFAMAHPDATIKVCLWMALLEERLLYGDVYACASSATPKGLLS